MLAKRFTRMRPWILIGGLALSAPAAAAEATGTGTGTGTDAAKERVDNAELKKSVDDLRAAVDRLGDKVSGRAAGSADETVKWLQDKTNEVGQALKDAGDKVDGKADKAQAETRDSLANALKSLGKTIDHLAGQVQSAQSTGTGTDTGK